MPRHSALLSANVGTQVRRIGHKGADALVSGNTLASFDAALAIGVDMIELDVLDIADVGLVVAHDHSDAHSRVPLSLDSALDHLNGSDFAGIGLLLDLKQPGYETEVAEALAARSQLQRSIISTQFRGSLDKLRKAWPEIRRSWTIPRASRDYLASPLMAVPALVVLRAMRLIFPGRAGIALGSGLCQVVTAHWRLVTGSLVRAVHRAGGEIYVWTVDDQRKIRQLTELGVDGIITNDPRLFEPRTRQSA